MTMVKLMAHDFDEAVFGTPSGDLASAVLFYFGENPATKVVLEEFEKVSNRIVNIVNLYTMDCATWRAFCVAQNAHLGGQAPSASLVIYRPKPATAHVYNGLLEHLAMEEAVLRHMTTNTLPKITANNYFTFLQSGLRPFKAILFYSGDGVPAFIHVLAADVELRRHVHFGYAEPSEEAVASHFNVEEKPAIVFQRGAATTTRRIYAGLDRDFWDIDAVRQFLWEAIADHGRASFMSDTFPPLGEQLRVPVEVEETDSGVVEVIVQDEANEVESSAFALPSSTFRDVKFSLANRLLNVAIMHGQLASRSATGDLVVHQDSEQLGDRRTVFLLGASLSAYEKLSFGADGCPPGLEIVSVDECERALESLGISATPKWVSAYDGLPRWCSVRETTSKNSRERMHFNSASAGAGREDLAPICKAGTGLTRALGSKAAEAGTATPKAEPAKIQEVTSANYEELFGTDGFSVIYLSEGPISGREMDLLFALKNRFEPSFRDQGTKMRWMWMDAHVERKLTAIFDPPILPSAVILNPHKRPRFAKLKHGAEDEEPQPASEDALALLFRSVFGGDARFTPIVPMSKLTTSWANRGNGASAALEADEQEDPDVLSHEPPTEETGDAGDLDV